MSNLIHELEQIGFFPQYSNYAAYIKEVCNDTMKVIATITVDDVLEIGIKDATLEIDYEICYSAPIEKFTLEGIRTCLVDATEDITKAMENDPELYTAPTESFLTNFNMCMTKLV